MSRRELANAIRALSMDAVENANSGHPGMPMGMADIAEVLWNDFLQHNPANPHWFNRDRFILSNGHGCMLLYAALHLSGYDLPMGELKRFRQLHSMTPGHPESGHTPGVEVTTGPLGQGLSNSVGVALAEALLAEKFNRPQYSVVDHYTYVFCGDGDLMEGISHEAGSLAGTLGLGKLIVVYDDNGISIDGKVSGWFLDDTSRRFASYGWQTIGPIDGHDSEAVRVALEQARADSSRPSLILAKTVIGYGAPNKQGTASTHGSALGKDEVAAARKSLGWKYPPFEIPESIYAAWDAKERGKRQEDRWSQLMNEYAKAYPELAKELQRRISGHLPSDWDQGASAYIAKIARNGEKKATRKASGEALAAFAPLLPEIVGGSADLTPSNDTYWPTAQTITPQSLQGNYLHWGVREFGMSGALNGLAAHGGFVPYGGTFLVFSDYARNAVRVASIAKYPTIFVYTHDSIGVGEDGPTHQPIEHVASLRAMPGLVVWRPADDVETAVAWKEAIDRRDGPSALILTRQAVPHFPYFDERVEGIRRGGYILHEPEREPVAIVLASGSEVALAMEAAAELDKSGIWTRVVSLPSHELFLQQEATWQEKVLPARLRVRVAVEAAASISWHRFVGLDGEVVALDRYGESAPGNEVFDDLGITSRRVGTAVRQVLALDKN